MIRRYLMALRVGLMAADAISAFVVFLVVSFLRFQEGTATELWRNLGIEIWLAAALFAITWVAALWLEGLYRMRVRWRLWSEVRDMLKAALLVVAFILSALFVLKQTNVSRLFLALLFVTQFAVTLASRVWLRALFERARRRGYDPRYMVVAGTGQLAQTFADRIENHPGLGITIIGHLSTPGGAPPVVTREILGSVDEIADILHSRVVDEVAVCLPEEASRFLEPISVVAAGEGKTVRIPVDPIEGVPAAIQEEFDGMLVRSLVHDGQREVALMAKRGLDIVGSLVGLVVLSPLMLAAAVAIWAREGRPILYGQTRVGLHGRPFTIWKFRTMVPDADRRLDEVRHLNERSGVTFKATNDPRITPLGRLLRRTSIDELPQLWNVLIGEMSLVGPRPPLEQEVAEYDVWHRRRLSMKPGMTGLWQVEARHDPEFDRLVEHDLTYIDGWTIWLDFKILAKTVPALLMHGGR
jgi:exopolysaccharide biosynthesis polyprenyl glycosylphosphotransferase